MFTRLQPSSSNEGGVASFLTDGPPFFFSLPCTSDRVSLTGLHVRIRSSTTDEVMAFALMSPAPHLAQMKFFFFFLHFLLPSMQDSHGEERAFVVLTGLDGAVTTNNRFHGYNFS